MKTTLELRPVYHRLEDRIRAHVNLCWLALLLVRIIETTTGDTWNRVQRDILNKLAVDAPKFIELGPPPATT